MYRKIIINDVRKSKLITITITAFILLAAMLTSLAAILSVNLLSAINNMMLRAQTPHFMQMHSGDIDMERLSAFAGTEKNVKDFQVLSFLNIEGAEIVIGENSLAGSVQDNGLSVQSKRFDFLLDLDGNIIYPAKGEIYVPIYYMKQGLASIGDSITIHDVSFTVAGFLRDSQMNASMISSKRFLINESDFEKVREFGKLEYLIEFRFSDSSAVSAFESGYIAAGLPANGPPAITHSLFKLVNALDDGMMIAMLILISVLVIMINFLCIRFTLIAKIEEDYREIGVLKAIGLQVGSIKKLYLAKYGALAGIACIAGFISSLFAKEPLMENIRLYMGGEQQFRPRHGIWNGRRRCYLFRGGALCERRSGPLQKSISGRGYTLWSTPEWRQNCEKLSAIRQQGTPAEYFSWHKGCAFPKKALQHNAFGACYFLVSDDCASEYL